MKFKKAPQQVLSSITDVFTFGKFKGCTVEDALHDEPFYFNWLMENRICKINPSLLRQIEEIQYSIMDEKQDDDIFLDWMSEEPH